MIEKLNIGGQIAWFFKCISLCLLVTGASGQVKVLLLHSYESHLPWVEQFTEGVKRASGNTLIYNEYLDAERLIDQSESLYIDYLLDRYGDLGIDAILVNSSAASVLVGNHRQAFDQISPVRVYYSMLDLAIGPNELLVSPDFSSAVSQTMMLAQQLQPKIGNILVIEGPTFVSREIGQTVSQAIDTQAVTLEVMRSFTLPELDQTVANLPDDSVIFLSLVFSDSQGNQYVPKDIAKRVVEHANVPVYTLYNSFMGTGAVGGYLFDGVRVGETMYEAAMDLVDDQRLSREYKAERAIFDASAMAQFGLSRSLLPVDVELVNQPARISERYPRLVELVLMMLLISVLLAVVWLGRQHWYSKRLESKNVLLSRLKKELTAANRRLHELATYDSLTGLFNRQAAEPLLEDASNRLRRYHTPSVLLVVDIDDFKKVNDQYGHKIGDEVLASVATALSAHLRESDVIARWGGEEFLVLLANTDASGAQVAAQALCQAVENESQEPGCTVSIGGAPLAVGDCWSKSFNEADKLLYQAKRAGKNQAIIASSDQ